MYYFNWVRLLWLHILGGNADLLDLGRINQILDLIKSKGPTLLGRIIEAAYRYGNAEKIDRITYERIEKIIESTDIQIPVRRVLQKFLFFIWSELDINERKNLVDIHDRTTWQAFLDDLPVKEVSSRLFSGFVNEFIDDQNNQEKIMKIKRLFYDSWLVHQKKDSMDEEKLSAHIPENADVIYKLPWDKFVWCMENHYDEIHNPATTPERYVEILDVIGKYPGFVSDENEDGDLYFAAEIMHRGLSRKDKLNSLDIEKALRVMAAGRFRKDLISNLAISLLTASISDNLENINIDIVSKMLDFIDTPEVEYIFKVYVYCVLIFKFLYSDVEERKELFSDERFDMLKVFLPELKGKVDLKAFFALDENGKATNNETQFIRVAEGFAQQLFDDQDNCQGIMSVKRALWNVKQIQDDETVLSEDSLNAPIPEMAEVVYKLEWDEFVWCMDNYYHEIHGPETLPERYVEILDEMRGAVGADVVEKSEEEFAEVLELAEKDDFEVEELAAFFETIVREDCPESVKIKLARAVSEKYQKRTAVFFKVEHLRSSFDSIIKNQEAESSRILAEAIVYAYSNTFWKGRMGNEEYADKYKQEFVDIVMEHLETTQETELSLLLAKGVVQAYAEGNAEVLSSELSERFLSYIERNPNNQSAQILSKVFLESFKHKNADSLTSIQIDRIITILKSEVSDAIKENLVQGLFWSYFNAQQPALEENQRKEIFAMVTQGELSSYAVEGLFKVYFYNWLLLNTREQQDIKASGEGFALLSRFFTDVGQRMTVDRDFGYRNHIHHDLEQSDNYISIIIGDLDAFARNNDDIGVAMRVKHHLYVLWKIQVKEDKYETYEDARQDPLPESSLPIYELAWNEFVWCMDNYYDQLRYETEVNLDYILAMKDAYFGHLSDSEQGKIVSRSITGIEKDNPTQDTVKEVLVGLRQPVCSIENKKKMIKKVQEIYSQDEAPMFDAGSVKMVLDILRDETDSEIRARLSELLRDVYTEDKGAFIEEGIFQQLFDLAYYNIEEDFSSYLIETLTDAFENKAIVKVESNYVAKIVELVETHRDNESLLSLFVMTGAAFNSKRSVGLDKKTFDRMIEIVVANPLHDLSTLILTVLNEAYKNRTSSAELDESQVSALINIVKKHSESEATGEIIDLFWTSDVNTVDVYLEIINEFPESDLSEKLSRLLIELYDMQEGSKFRSMHTDKVCDYIKKYPQSITSQNLSKVMVKAYGNGKASLLTAPSWVQIFEIIEDNPTSLAAVNLARAYYEASAYIRDPYGPQGSSQPIDDALLDFMFDLIERDPDSEVSKWMLKAIEKQLDGKYVNKIESLSLGRLIGLMQDNLYSSSFELMAEVTNTFFYKHPSKVTTSDVDNLIALAKENADNPDLAVTLTRGLGDVFNVDSGAVFSRSALENYMNLVSSLTKAEDVKQVFYCISRAAHAGEFELLSHQSIMRLVEFSTLDLDYESHGDIKKIIVYAYLFGQVESLDASMAEFFATFSENEEFENPEEYIALGAEFLGWLFASDEQKEVFALIKERRHWGIFIDKGCADVIKESIKEVHRQGENTGQDVLLEKANLFYSFFSNAQGLDKPMQLKHKAFDLLLKSQGKEPKNISKQEIIYIPELAEVIYKLPWNQFVWCMENYYDEIHDPETTPEKYIEILNALSEEDSLDVTGLITKIKANINNESSLDLAGKLHDYYFQATDAQYLDDSNITDILNVIATTDSTELRRSLGTVLGMAFGSRKAEELTRKHIEKVLFIIEANMQESATYNLGSAVSNAYLHGNAQVLSLEHLKRVLSLIDSGQYETRMSGLGAIVFNSMSNNNAEVLDAEAYQNLGRIAGTGKSLSAIPELSLSKIISWIRAGQALAAEYTKEDGREAWQVITGRFPEEFRLGILDDDSNQTAEIKYVRTELHQVVSRLTVNPNDFNAAMELKYLLYVVWKIQKGDMPSMAQLMKKKNYEMLEVIYKQNWEGFQWCMENHSDEMHDEGTIADRYVAILDEMRSALGKEVEIEQVEFVEEEAKESEKIDYSFLRKNYNQMWVQAHARYRKIIRTMTADTFDKIFNGLIADIDAVLPYRRDYVTLIRAMFQGEAGAETHIRDDEAADIRSISIHLARNISKAAKDGRIKFSSGSRPTFRTTVRKFNDIFSYFYLIDRETALENVYDYFILAVWTVYGRMLDPSSREELAKLIKQTGLNEKYLAIFVRSNQSQGNKYTLDYIQSLFDYGRFDRVGKETPIDLGQPASYSQVAAAAERARSSEMTATIKVPSGHIPDVVNKALSKDGEVFGVPFSEFTKKGDILGRNFFEPGNGPVWVPGSVERVINYAKEHPTEQVYLNFEGPSDAAGHLLTSLHDLIEKREFKSDVAKNSAVEKLPPNMQIIITEHTEADMTDAAFNDRSAAYILPTLSDTDLRIYLTQTCGNNDIADAVIKEVSSKFSGLPIKNRPSIYDLEFIARNAVQRTNISAIEAVKEEAELHLSAKYREGKIAERVKELYGASKDKDLILINKIGDDYSLNMAGIEFKLSQESGLLKYLQENNINSNTDFSSIFAKYMGDEYFVTSTEEQMLCLLARIHQFSASDAVFLKGLSGEGKTTILRVFNDIIGLTTIERTISPETTESLFEGAPIISESGIEMRESEFDKTLSDDGYSYLLNEADTREEIFKYLAPQILGRDKVLNNQGAVASSRQLGRSMYAFTGNIRSELPLYISEALFASYQYQSTEEENKEITRRWMKSRRDNLEVDMSQKDLDDFSDRLFAIFKPLRKVALDKEMLSNREITRREIGRFTSIFFDLIKNKEHTPEEAFAFAVEIVFVRMWHTESDMEFARKIAENSGIGSDSWPNIDQIKEFIKSYESDVPLMVLDRDKKSAELRVDSDTVVHDVPMSRFHSLKSLVGGLGLTEDDANARQEIGKIPWVILQARLSGGTEKHLLRFRGYLDMHPQVAPAFNEFYPTGELDVSELSSNEYISDKVIDEINKSKYKNLILNDFYEYTGYDEIDTDLKDMSPDLKEEFTFFMLGVRPDNLEISAIEEPEQVPDDRSESLHPADIDRFLVINLSEGINGLDVESNVKDVFDNDLAAEVARTAYDLYKEQYAEEVYPHIRINGEHIRAYATELKRREQTQGSISEDEIKLVGHIMLGAGLSVTQERNYNSEFLEKSGVTLDDFDFKREYRSDGNGNVEFVITAQKGEKVIDIARHSTSYRSAKQADNRGRYRVVDKNNKQRILRLKAPMQDFLFLQAGIMINEDNNLIPVLEGDPGGAKTTAFSDLSDAEGRDYYEEPMSDDVSVTSLLGAPVFVNDKIQIPVLDKDKEGKFVRNFIRAFVHGGRLLADEGASGENADYLLRWMMRVIQQGELDLGDIYPGLQGVVLTKSDDFRFAITQNLHFKTGGRRPLDISVDRKSSFMYVPSTLTQRSAVELIEYYDEENITGEDLRNQLARVHIKMVESHPQNRMLSPRDLIDVLALVKKRVGRSVNGSRKRKAINDALSVVYLESITDVNKRREMAELIKAELGDFVDKGNYAHKIENRKQSDVAKEEIEHLLVSPSLKSAARACDFALSAQGRHILLNESQGADGVEFLKMLSYLNGAKLDIHMGYPGMGAKQLLGGQVPVYENYKEDDKGRVNPSRKADGTFKWQMGVLGRYLVREDELEIYPESAKIPVIAALTNIEEIYPADLVSLNGLLTSGKITLPDESGAPTTYVLPEWVSFIPVTRNLEALTSPFANRFRRMSVPEIKEDKDIVPVIQKLYPNVTSEEISALRDVVVKAQQYTDKNYFEMKYGFNVTKVFELAKRIQMYKQFDHKKGKLNDDPLYYVVRALDVVVRQGMYSGDIAIFDDEVMVDSLLSSMYGAEDKETLTKYYKTMIFDIRSEIDEEYDRKHETVLTKEEVLEGRKLLDGTVIYFDQEEDRVVVVTGKAVRFLTFEQLEDTSKEFKLSESMSFRKDSKGKYILTKRLLSRIGTIELPDDQWLLERSLSPSDMPGHSYMSHSQAMIVGMKSSYESAMPVVTATGKRISGGLTAVSGESGTGKSSRSTHMSAMDGAVDIRINPHRETAPQSMGMEISFTDGLEMNISEFLAGVAKINGKYVQKSYQGADRVRVTIDEANVTRDAWLLFDAIARGYTKFFWETPDGKRTEIELVKHVEVFFTLNPAERYGGLGDGASRFAFPDVINSRATHLVVNDPLDEFTVLEQDNMLEDVFERGKNRKEREEALSKFKGKEVKSTNNHQNLEDDVFVVKKVSDVKVKTRNEMEKVLEGFAIKEEDVDPGKEMSDEDKQKLEQEMRELFDYDEKKIWKALAEIEMIKDDKEKIAVFMKDVVRQVINALAVDILPDFRIIFKQADKIDIEFGKRLRRIIERYELLYSSDEVSQVGIEGAALALKKLAFEFDVFLEECTPTIYSNDQEIKIGLLFDAVPIVVKLVADKNKLEPWLNQKDWFTKAFTEGNIPDVITLGRGMGVDGVLGYYDSEDIVTVNIDDEYERLSVAWHELGHVASDNIAKFDEDMENVLSRNVETYSVLFPLIMFDKHQKYLNSQFIQRIENMKRVDDPYSVAALAILNAFAQHHGWDLRVDYEKWDDKEHTLLVVKELVKRLNKLNPKQIQETAQELFLNPKTYFSDMPQTYYQSGDGSMNVSINGKMERISLGNGLNVKPKIAPTKKKKIPNEKKSDDKSKGSQSKNKKKSGKKLVSDKERINNIFTGSYRKLPKALESIVKKFEKFFAPDPPRHSMKTRIVSPEAATIIDIGAYAAREFWRMFRAPFKDKKRKKRVLNLKFIVDTSGTVTGDVDLTQRIEEAFLHYAALSARLSKNNPDINLSLASITTEYNEVITYSQWKEARTPEAKRELVGRSVKALWDTGTGGGIESEPMIEALKSEELPKGKDADVYTQIVVFTDGQETGGLKGAALKAEIEKYVADNTTNKGKIKYKTNVTFLGIQLSDGGAELRDHYPARGNLGEDASGEKYLEALLELCMMQAENKEIVGDLFIAAGDSDIAGSALTDVGGIDFRSLNSFGEIAYSRPHSMWNKDGLVISSLVISDNTEQFLEELEHILYN